MDRLELFPDDTIVGTFRGFREGGLEFHADLVLPYQSQFQSIPMHGQFLLVQLEAPDEAVLGRITALSAEGRLTSPSGEDFSIRAMRDHRPIPEELREDYLRYRVNIRVLGVLRLNAARNAVSFIPSHRRLPHVGSQVAFPSDELLRHIVGHYPEEGAAIGQFALGEYIYADQGSQALAVEDWMQFREPDVQVRFPVHSLVSRRSFVFARAGFGKSNLVKLLFSELYRETPTVLKRGGRPVPVGTVIFDPDGEYFWPDDRGRPGLADVPELRDRLVVFTSRRGPSPYYQSFVAGGIKLDIRRLRPADVIGIALSPDRQEQQNVRKLAGLSMAHWEQLVDLIHADKHGADLTKIADLMGLDASRQEVEALAARANMVRIVSALHDPTSQLMDMLIEALSQWCLCVVDVSQMRGSQALILSGLILRRIFDRNQEHFTSASPETIPTIAVVEEAQAVLSERATSAEPYIAWVKEGRKYDLGAVLITQQPGSIPPEILSQGDNWFIFHLLSAVDLVNVKRANAHFSDDILSVLLNEPIAGHGVVWSSVGPTKYPVSMRAFSFEKLYAPQDPDYRRSAVETAASRLKDRFLHEREALFNAVAAAQSGNGHHAQSFGQLRLDGQVDAVQVATELDEMALCRQLAIQSVENSRTIGAKLQRGGLPWGELNKLIAERLPQTLDNRETLAYRLGIEALNHLFGKDGWEWFIPEGHTRKWLRVKRAL